MMAPHRAVGEERVETPRGAARWPPWLTWARLRQGKTLGGDMGEDPVGLRHPAKTIFAGVRHPAESGGAEAPSRPPKRGGRERGRGGEGRGGGGVGGGGGAAAASPPPARPVTTSGPKKKTPKRRQKELF